MNGIEQMRAGTAWMVLQTNRGAELMVKAQAEAHGCEAYMPLASRVLTVRGAKCAVVKSEPVFPGYLFVRRLSTMKVALTGLPGVKYLMVRGVPDREILRFRAAEVDGFIQLFSKAKVIASGVSVGDKVTTKDGLLEMVVTEVLSKNRVACLSTFLGSSRTIEVDLTNVVRTGGIEGQPS